MADKPSVFRVAEDDPDVDIAHKIADGILAHPDVTELEYVRASESYEGQKAFIVQYHTVIGKCGTMMLLEEARTYIENEILEFVIYHGIEEVLENGNPYTGAKRDHPANGERLADGVRQGPDA